MADSELIDFIESTCKLRTQEISKALKNGDLTTEQEKILHIARRGAFNYILDIIKDYREK